MANLEDRVQLLLEAGVTRVGYDPRLQCYYARGVFQNLTVTSYLKEDDVNYANTSHRDGEAMALEKLYQDARRVILDSLKQDEEGKLGFGSVR